MSFDTALTVLSGCPWLQEIASGHAMLNQRSKLGTSFDLCRSLLLIQKILHFEQAKAGTVLHRAVVCEFLQKVRGSVGKSYPRSLGNQPVKTSISQSSRALFTNAVYF